MRRCALLFPCWVACNPPQSMSEDSDNPTPVVNPTGPLVVEQLAASFTDTLTQGFACESNGFVGMEDVAVLLNEAHTVRLQLHGSSSMVVFVGDRLGGPFSDADACDDLVGEMRPLQRVGMAWSSTAGTYTAHNGPEGRTFELLGTVLVPDPQYEFLGNGFADTSAYGDADAFVSVGLTGVELGIVAHGGQLLPLR